VDLNRCLKQVFETKGGFLGQARRGGGILSVKGVKSVKGAKGEKSL
jgi:hypothetical protein